MKAAAALALALMALSLSIWIVVPGPVLALFALGVGATELWPFLTLFSLLALTVSSALPRRSHVRNAAGALAAVALLCTLVPPVAYLLRGPYVPLRAFWSSSPAQLHAPAPDAPVVFAIYGGAWQRGSPRNDGQLNATIASWGYKVVALNYPHAPAARWPAQRTAILQQIDESRAARIVLLGHSSGAQLAMIAAALRPRRIAGVITYESPVDLVLGFEYPSQPDIIDARKIIGDLCGGTPAQQPACYRSASPRYVVHAGMPPVLMFAAGRDHVVDVGFEHLLRDELRGDGVSVTYVELPWADHAFEEVPFGFHDRIALWFARRFLKAVTAGQEERGGYEQRTGSRRNAQGRIRFDRGRKTRTLER